MTCPPPWIWPSALSIPRDDWWLNLAGKDRQEPDWEIDSCCEGAVAAQLGRVQKVEYMLSRIIRTCGLWPLVDVGGGGAVGTFKDYSRTGHYGKDPQQGRGCGDESRKEVGRRQVWEHVAWPCMLEELEVIIWKNWIGQYLWRQYSVQIRLYRPRYKSQPSLD